jgi:hypothetical protein
MRENHHNPNNSKKKNNYEFLNPFSSDRQIRARSPIDYLFDSRKQNFEDALCIIETTNP